MKRIFLVAFCLPIWMLLFLGMMQWQSNFSANNVITTTVNLFACAKAVGGVCNYNGDAGTTTINGCPDDSCDGLSKATPVRTVQGVANKVNGKILLNPGIVIVNWADAALTGSDCYLMSAPVDFKVTTIPYGEPNWYPDPKNGVTDAYPSSYIMFQGNDTTQTNLGIKGSTTCAGNTSSTRVGVRFQGANILVRSMAFLYFGGAAVQVDRGTAYVEKTTFVSDNKGTAVQVTGGHLKFGGSSFFTNVGVFSLNQQTVADTITPIDSTSTAASLTANISGSLTQTPDPYGSCLVSVNGYSYFPYDKTSMSFAGAGTYNGFCSFDGGRIHPTDFYQGVATQNFSMNSSSATLAFAERGGNIVFGCAGGITCGTMIYLQRANARRFSTILIASASTPVGTNPDTADGGSTISDGAFPGLAHLNVTSISTTSTKGQNLSASCTMAAAATCTVSFATAEPDTSYFPVCYEDSATGQSYIGPSSKAVGSFVVNASAVNSATWRCIIWR